MHKTEEEWREICEYAATQGQRAAAKRFGIPRSTIQERMGKSATSGIVAEIKPATPHNSGHSGSGHPENRPPKPATLDKVPATSGRFGFGAALAQHNAKAITLHPADNRFQEAECGRGIPIKGMVLIAIDGDGNDVMLAEYEWRLRQWYKCPHGLWGCSCKPCLQRDAGLPVTSQTSRPANQEYDPATLEGITAWCEYLNSRLDPLYPKEANRKESDRLGLVAVEPKQHRLEDGTDIWLVRRMPVGQAKTPH